MLLRLASVATVLLAAAAVPARARAQMTGGEAVAAAAASRSMLPPDTLGGTALFGKIDEDWFLTLALRVSFDREDWGIGLQLPLRLRVIDNDPKNPNDYLGILRREDWDEPSKYLRVIRYVYVGQADKRGPFYVRVGELQGLTIGHGTIMYRYYNDIDVDSWHTGVDAAVNIGAFGGEAMISDVANPYVAGLRFTVRPLELALGDAWPWHKLVVGANVVADGRAPLQLRTTPIAVPASGGPPGASTSSTGVAVALDSGNHPIVSRARALGIFGLDLGLEVVSTELLSITPYSDLNKMTIVDKGWGWHLGILWELRLPLLIDTLTIDARTEYRRVTGDYIGPYFDTVYEIERYQVLGTPHDAHGVPLPVGAQTKLNTLLSGATAARNGVFFSLLAGLPNLIAVGGDYIAYDGDRNDGSLRLTLDVPALKVVRFTAFYYRTGVSGLQDLVRLDDRSAIVASASIPVSSFFALQLMWWRIWRAEADGSYQAVDDWSAGLGFNIAL